MELYLQVGYGMIGHASAVLEAWGGGGVILSPRDVVPERLPAHTARLRESGGNVYIDPQCYRRDATHDNLTTHSYWPQGQSRHWSRAEWNSTIDQLAQLNAECNAAGFIVPGSFCDEATDQWIDDQAQNVDQALRAAPGLDAIVTLALSDDVVKDASQIETIAERFANIGNACYIVAELPDPPYLTREPLWIVNLLDLISQMRLSGRRVILGYANHQMLIAASAGASAIAAGTWLNLRHFDLNRYFSSGDDSQSRRVSWYYSAAALSEFKIPTLDLAQRVGSLDLLRQSTPYSEILFSGPRPTSVAFNEGDSFRHYLTALRSQARSARQSTFEATINQHESLLDAAEGLIDRLAAQGIMDRARSFRDCIEPHRQALLAHRATSGPLLSRFWGDLG